MGEAYRNIKKEKNSTKKKIMQSSVLQNINKEIMDFQSLQINIVPGLYFNQYQTLQQIYFYHNSKYQTGEVDDEGDRKYFYNINRNPCKVFSKAIDFDTKNIRLLTTEGGNSLKTWFMERDLKYWMRDKQFGKVLNRIFKELPIFGTVVLKIVDGTPMFVDLRNFVVDQSADTLQDMNFKIEMHLYTVAEFRKIAKKMKWEQKLVDQVVTEFYQMKGERHIKLYERYGDVCDEKGNYTYRRTFIADVGMDQYDQYNNLIFEHNGVVLESKEWDEDPYWEFHADKVAGRWLGVGVVEELFEPQIAENQFTNLQTKTSYWSALRVFQTRDSAINRNMMSDVKNGEIINVDSEITQIDMSDRNLAFFGQQDQKWLRNRDELTFSYDVVQGERSPASTPLGETKINLGQTLSYFEGIQENLALDIKEMLYEVIIPQFEKDNTPEHVLRLVGKDLDVYIAMVKNEMVMQEIIRGFTLGRPFPTNEERDLIELAIEESIKQDKEKLLTIPKDFYKDVKYDVDIDITGESIDTRVRQATVFAILQAITADPTMTTDPVKKKILFMMAENGGLNPNEIFDVASKQATELSSEVSPMGGRAGGGVSAPSLGAKVPGTATMTV